MYVIFSVENCWWFRNPALGMWDKTTYQRVSRISSTKACGWHDFLLKELGEDSMTRPVKSSNKSTNRPQHVFLCHICFSTSNCWNQYFWTCFLFLFFVCVSRLVFFPASPLRKLVKLPHRPKAQGMKGWNDGSDPFKLNEINQLVSYCWCYKSGDHHPIPLMGHKNQPNL